MVLLIIGGAFLLLLVLLSTLPFRIIIDTQNNLYRAGIRYLAEVSVMSDAKEFIHLRIQLLFIPFKVFPTRWIGKRKAKRSSKLPKRVPQGFGIRKSWSILQAIRIKKIETVFDTGNPVVNAQLMPICLGLTTDNISLKPNFDGVNYLFILIETRIYKIIHQFIKTKN